MPLALTVTFGLQLLRVWIAGLFYYLNEVANTGYATLVGVAALVFATTFLAGAVRRRLGARALLIVGGGVGVVRLIEQINQDPGLDLIVASIGVALFLMFIPIMLETLRANEHDRHFATSIVLGVSIDTAIKGALGTLELSWTLGALPLVVVVIGVGLQLWLLARNLARSGAESGQPVSQGSSWTLIAIGPFLFLEAQLFQNIGHVTTLTGFSQPLAFELIVLANAFSLAAVSALYGRLPRRAWTWTFVVGLLLVVTTLPLVADLFAPLTADPLAPLELMAGQVAASIGLVIIGQARGTRPAARVIGTGLVIMFGLLLGYYIGHVVKLPIAHWLFQPLAALIVLGAMTLTALRSGETPTPDRLDWTPGLIGLGLMVLPVLALLGWQEPATTTGQLPIRIMSYNLHSGFDVTGRFNLEGAAQAIELEQADVIGLQEISRGWVLDGSIDMLTWLSQRLNLPYVWGSTADPMWGNAILSRYPIKDVQYLAMPNNDVVRPARGYLVATIEVGDGSISLIVTHLHHVGSDSALRVPQVQAVLGTWARRAGTVLLGDLNATPDAPEMQLLREAGLIDAFTEAGKGDGFTYASNRPFQRIDYIYHSADLSSQSFEVNPGLASDHRGIAVTIDRAR
ncbi:MAG: endonuclease/exonuclease/phosphatase family protein [Chloroflexi bacterium]|nr:endonuclease/exonuclease/phosphatase family protein [Chloroflexota bacterium]